MSCCCNWIRVRRRRRQRAKGKDDTILEKRQIWIMQAFDKTDRNDDGFLTFKEIQKLLQAMNMRMDKKYAYAKYKQFTDVNGKGMTKNEFSKYYRDITSRSEINELFNRYTDGDELTVNNLKDFLTQEQKLHEITEANCKDLILLYEPNNELKASYCLGIDGFTNLLTSKHGEIIKFNHQKQYQDMTQPLCHYYIMSSHNSYLVGHQLIGESSVDAYVDHMQKGVRSVELDCWDGDNGEPIIYHGHTLTSQITFENVIKAIAEYAFVTSCYPVILSIENHCSIEQQRKMAKYFVEILGDKLHKEPIDLSRSDAPSPEDLKYKVLVKGKKLKDENVVDEEEVSEDEEDDLKLSDVAKQKLKEKRDGKKPKLAVELSRVVNLIQSTHFKSFADTKKNWRYFNMCSLAETKADGLVDDNASDLVEMNKKHIVKIYPSGLRISSSNYNPQTFWNVGCQMVTMNLQSPGTDTDLYFGRFSVNGDTGYYLKPEFLRDTNTSFDPRKKAKSNEKPAELIIKVISGQQIPKPDKSSKGEIIDPYVKIQIHGIPADRTTKSTKTISNNGFNPRWGQILKFKILNPELALVRFSVYDSDALSADDFIGQNTVPLNSIGEGYRHIFLVSENRETLFPASLFVHVTIKRPVG